MGPDRMRIVTYGCIGRGSSSGSGSGGVEFFISRAKWRAQGRNISMSVSMALHDSCGCLLANAAHEHESFDRIFTITEWWWAGSFGGSSPRSAARLIVVVEWTGGVAGDIYSTAPSVVAVAGVYHLQHVALIERGGVEVYLIHLDWVPLPVTLVFGVVLAEVLDRKDAWSCGRRLCSSLLHCSVPENFGELGAWCRGSLNRRSGSF